MPTYKKLDVHTGKLSDSDVVQVVDGLHGTGVVRVKPAETIAGKKVGRLDLELFSRDGKSLGTYERIEGKPAIAQYTLISSFEADGSDVYYLLNARWDPIQVSRQPLRYIQGRVCKRVFGTEPEEDLWMILQADGTFAAPPGAIGVRPVDPNWSDKSHLTYPRTAGKWFVKYHLPGTEGYVAPATGPSLQWGEANAELTTFGPRQWDGVMLFRAPYVADGTYVTNRIDKPLQFVSRHGRWIGNFIDGSHRQNGDLVNAPTLPEAIADLLSLFDAARKLELKAEADKKAYQARRAREAFEASWRMAVANRDESAMRHMLAQKGPDGWYEYVMAVPMPSKELIEEAATKVKDPGKAKRIREHGRRVEAERQKAIREAAEYERTKMWERYDNGGPIVRNPTISAGPTPPSDSPRSSSSTFDSAAYGRQLESQLRQSVGRQAWEPWHGSR